ncbi:LuxR C-terminal-related transcriptional regulator [Natronobacterium haloterrestre]|uniref:LuxR C-terminal-related transcriptional regulator n=1 Tax=Natronobacterium haloterrestre TaxID=148448 RepID=UPI0015A5B45F|nr:LuxR C-terminal-related transcriptional regulator [Halobiforma haloterrestris]
MTDSRVANPHPLDLEHDRVVLSNREVQVIQKAQHKSYEEVGEDLGIAESTVGTYYSRANSKLGEQVTVIEAMLDQQRNARRDENIEAVARYAVERLRDRGLDVKFEIQEQEDKNG